jgi:tryptophanase
MIIDEAFMPQSNHPFHGNFDLQSPARSIEMFGRDCIAFVRIEGGTSLVGDQPIALAYITVIRDLQVPQHLLLHREKPRKCMSQSIVGRYSPRNGNPARSYL